MRVGLDCANGSAWNIAKTVFEALGAKTFVINAEPDGVNINRGAGSTHIDGLRRFVVENHLDVGFAYDGDADRCLAVDENGEAIGTLRDVLKPNTVCDVYVFDTARGELMIPALKRVVRKVDVDAGVMTLDRAVLNEVAVWEDEPAERDE